MMNRYDKVWNKKASQLSKALMREKWYFSSVGVERFELPISCSQGRLKILYKSNFTSVSVVENESLYKQKTFKYGAWF